MSDSRFPVRTDDLISTLSDLFDAQQKGGIATLLRSAEASIDESGYDNWNGGTTYYELNLAIPVSRFAKLESAISKIEADIQSKVDISFRRYGNDKISGVSITPAVVPAGAPRTVNSDD